LIDRGEAMNRWIIAGEWWRTITALTLHRDLSHFMANLGFGLLFAAFLQPRLGGGVTWLGIVLSGALGNSVNAWFYKSSLHSSIGASTAVFGGLGLLMAWEFIARWRIPHTRHWWQFVVPLGGGLALLAFLGSSDEAAGDRTDYMAHFLGFRLGNTPRCIRSFDARGTIGDSVGVRGRGADSASNCVVVGRARWIAQGL
jgi:membrane associated rhomboid family serine protease